MEERLGSELIACAEQGAAARRAGAEHGSNPHLASVKSGAPDREQSDAVSRCEAWWDGFEEVDRSLNPPKAGGFKFR